MSFLLLFINIVNVPLSENYFTSDLQVIQMAIHLLSCVGIYLTGKKHFYQGKYNCTLEINSTVHIWTLSKSPLCPFHSSLVILTVALALSLASLACSLPPLPLHSPRESRRKGWCIPIARRPFPSFNQWPAE